VQRGAQDRAAVAAELVGNETWVEATQEGKDGGVARLHHCADALHEVVGDAEVFFPALGIKRASRRPERTATHRRGSDSSGCARAPGERDREDGPEKTAQEAAPGRAFAGRHLIALVHTELPPVVAR